MADVTFERVGEIVAESMQAIPFFEADSGDSAEAICLAEVELLGDSIDIVEVVLEMELADYRPRWFTGMSCAG